MTKKDYQAIAQAIKDWKLNNIANINNNLEDDTPVIMARGFLDDLCNILKADNPRFNADLFREACK